MGAPLLRVTDSGIYCEHGDLYIDPWRAVDRAIITHAHSDHARWGSASYLCAEPGRELLRLRVGEDASIDSLKYGELRLIGDVRVSLHPAGHILGSAQVRCERDGEVWVVTGDYKTERDSASGEFELVRCNTLITESTFGLPIFRWRPQQEVFDEINAWWRANAAAGVTSVVYGYALGKAERVIAGVDASIGPILAHGAVMRFLDPYRAQGVALPDVQYAGAEAAKRNRGKALVVAPPSADTEGWLRKFGEARTAFASGWMHLRRLRRQRNVDRGFVLSDHVDWPALLATIEATGAERIGVTHGYATHVVRYLQENGKDAWALATPFANDEELEE
jgi:putative mRNA 3-end processing factor